MTINNSSSDTSTNGWGQSLPKSSPVDLVGFVNQKEIVSNLINQQGETHGTEENASLEGQVQSTGKEKKEVNPLNLSDLVNREESISIDPSLEKGEVPPPDSTKESESQEEVTTTEETPTEKTAKPAKLFDLTIGEDQLEIPEDAILEVTIDGEKQKVSLKDFASGISGEKAIQRRFADIHKEKQILKREREAFVNDKTIVENHFKGAKDLVLQNNPFKAIVELLPKVAGINPIDVQRAIINQSKALVQELSNYSEEEVTRALHEEGLKFQKNTLEEERKTVAKEKSQIELDKYVSTLQKQYGIDDELFSTAWKVMKEGGYEESAAKQNKSATNIADDVVKFILDENKKIKISSVVEKVDPVIAKDDNFVKTVITLVDQAFPEGGLTEEDIKDIVIGIKGTPINKQPPANSTQKEPTRTATPNSPKASPVREERKIEVARKEPALRFEDIIDRYR